MIILLLPKATLKNNNMFCRFNLFYVMKVLNESFSCCNNNNTFVYINVKHSLHRTPIIMFVS